MFNNNLDSSWLNGLKLIFKKPEITNLVQNLSFEFKKHNVFPSKSLIFNAFTLTKFNDVKVVILGQDPYHNINQAHGLSFSVLKGTKNPPSLKNIYKEIESDLGIKMSSSGDLTPWAKQGVLLLNSILTVRAHKPASHKNIGWENFTDEAIKLISLKKENVVFLLWGKFAQEKAKLIDGNKHLILTAAHPSPFSAYRGFYGCRHFSKCNDFLKQKNKEPINWTI